MNLHAWWNSLDALLRILYVIALPSTLLLFIQLLLAIIGFSGAGAPDGGAPDAGGLDADGAGNVDLDAPDAGIAGDVDLDAPDGDLPAYGFDPQDAADVPANEPGFDALRLFTFSGVVSFFTVFSWSSILLHQADIPGALAVVIALVSGCAAMYLVAKLFQLSRRLTENGNLHIENAIDLSARVYIPIPGAQAGKGKVTLVLQGSFVELSAVTNEAEAIPSGASVVVVAVAGETLVVARDSSDV